jgi:hypothetical protein
MKLYSHIKITILLFKDYSSDAEKIIQRLVLEAYMGDCYREIE